MRQTLLKDDNGHIDYVADENGFLMVEIYHNGRIIAYLGAAVWRKLVEGVNALIGDGKPYKPVLKGTN